MEKEKLTLEQKVNLKMARSYLVKAIFHSPVYTEYYEEINEMIEVIEQKLQK